MDESPDRGRRILVWVASIALAVIFLSEGAAKFPERRMWVGIFEQIGFGQWFRIFTGVVEVGGAVLLLIPATRRWGAVLLACTMIGALLVHVFVMGVSPPTIGVVLLLVALVAIGVDSRRRPNQSRSSAKVPV
ncbi:MAG TPA: DoxX family protein [Vicinamibacterales bacterium]|nr:DoxX family protein [Vicinamibacterales bacterium]